MSRSELGHDDSHERWQLASESGLPEAFQRLAYLDAEFLRDATGGFDA